MRAWVRCCAAVCPGVLGGVVLDPGEVATAHECERSDADSSRLCRGGHRRRSVAASDEPNQRLNPRRAAESGGHVAEAMPEARARADEKRANGRCAERELGGELAVAEPANLAQEEGLALGGAASARPPPTWLRSLPHGGRGQRRPVWCRRPPRRQVQEQQRAGGSARSTRDARPRAARRAALAAPSRSAARGARRGRPAASRPRPPPGRAGASGRISPRRRPCSR